MTDKTNTPAPAQEAVQIALEAYAAYYDQTERLQKDEGCLPAVSPAFVATDIRTNMVNAVVQALSKLRAPVADERADDTLTQVYDRFGIGILARNPSTLMACLGNVIRRANCLSQVEQVLSVPMPPEPEDDGVWGEESLLRWGADEKGYAEHFKAALAEWSRRAALASAPVAGEAQPVCWIYRTHLEGLLDDGNDEASVYRREAGRAIGPDEVPLYAAPQASGAGRDVAVQEFITAVDALLASEARETWSPSFKQKLTTAERMRIAETYRKARAALSVQPGAQKGEQ